MKIEKFSEQLYEFNSKDLKVITGKNPSDYFTIALEFELETEDETNFELSFEDFDYDSLDEYKKEVIKELPAYGISTRTNKQFIDNIINSIEELLDRELSDNKLTIEVNKLLNQNNYEDEEQQTIIELMQHILKAYLAKEDIDFLKSKVETLLPNFYKKYNTLLKWELDASLERGIEFSPKLYLVGLDKTVELIKIFFEDYNKQDYWKFTEKTGLHVNIGIKGKDWSNFNPLKGLVMLDDFDMKDIPFVYKEMTWRMNNKFAGSLKEKTIEYIKSEKNTLAKLDLHNIRKVEDFFYEFLMKVIEKEGVKHIGFNMAYL